MEEKKPKKFVPKEKKETIEDEDKKVEEKVVEKRVTTEKKNKKIEVYNTRGNKLVISYFKDGKQHTVTVKHKEKVTLDYSDELNQALLPFKHKGITFKIL